MQCKQVREHLSAYLDRELTAELASAVRHHLASCPECRATLEELRTTADLLGRLPARPAPADLAGDVQREIERRMLAPQAADETDTGERTLAVHRGRLWPRVLAVAACIVLAVGIGTVAFLGSLPLDEPPAAGPERLARHEAWESDSGAAPAGEAPMRKKGATKGADETAPAEIGLRVAGKTPEPAAARPSDEVSAKGREAPEADASADAEPPLAKAAPRAADEVGAKDAAELAKAAPSAMEETATPKAGEIAKVPDHRMARAGPTETAEAPADKWGAQRGPAAPEPAEPQFVQWAMNSVATGEAPPESLRQAATPRNLDRAPNQLVVRAPSRPEANRDLVRLFAENDWRAVDEPPRPESAPKKAPAGPTVGPGAAPAKGGRPEGLYYLAHRDGEDLWVVVTTADDLSRFATQVAQSRTMVVGADSSRPFRAVRRLQRELAAFEAKTYARAGAGGTIPAYKEALRARAEADEALAEQVPGAPDEATPPLKAKAGGEPLERRRRREEPGESEQEGIKRQDEKESAVRRSVSPAFVPKPTADQAEAPGAAADAAEDAAADDEAGEEASLSRYVLAKTAEESAEASEQAETKAVAAQQAKQIDARGEASREAPREGREKSDEKARKKDALKEAPAAEGQQHFSLEAIPPNQVMLVVRVRSAETPPAAALQTEAETETTAPAKAEPNTAPAAGK